MIAVNPFKNVQIYGEEFLSAYQTKGLDAPHVYAVADAAYDEMMRGEWKHFLSHSLDLREGCESFYVSMVLR